MRQLRWRAFRRSPTASRPSPTGAARRGRLSSRRGGTRSPRRARSCRSELPALRLDRLDELVEALREAGDALLDQLARHAIDADAAGLHLAQSLAGLLHARVERALHVAVVDEGRDRVERHGVDRLRTDQLLDVDDVAVVGVLRAGAGPEAALDARAGSPQIGEVVSAEDLVEGHVRHLGVGDRGAAAGLEIGAVPLLLQVLVDLGIDAADEE